MNVLSEVNFLNLLAYELLIRKFLFVSDVYNAYDISTPFILEKLYLFVLCVRIIASFAKKKKIKKIQWDVVEKLFLRNPKAKFISQFCCFTIWIWFDVNLGNFWCEVMAFQVYILVL